LPRGSYFVAETASGKLIGCGGWSRQLPGTGEISGNIGHIRHFATHSGWTGQGIGRALYDVCEAQASATGIAQFDCFASLNAEGFYAALGFERVDRIEVAMPGVSFPGILMRREI
jgi:N-acetylglutamate synthase-like GNAT family acetyltransferase